MIKDTLNQFEKTLGNMLKVLDKAQEFCLAKKIEPSILLNSRLAPDQFHFTRQIQIASDTAKFMAAKLSNKTPPAFEDNEVTIEELKTRIEKTINYISGFNPSDFKGYEDIRTTNPRMPGKFLPGNEYFFQHALPNFFFHMTTAYAILRHNGVDLGKKDFLGTINYRDL